MIVQACDFDDENTIFRHEAIHPKKASFDRQFDGIDERNVSNRMESPSFEAKQSHMKQRKPYGKYLFIVANVLFWGIFMHNVIVEYYENAEFYEKMEMLKEQGEYEAYLAASTEDKRVMRSFSVPKERLEEHTAWACIERTLRLFLPFIALIYINWLLLIPRFLAKKAYWKYSLGLLATLLGMSFLLSFHEVFGGTSQFIAGGNVIFTFDSIMEATGASLMALGFSTPIYLSYSWFSQQNQINLLENKRLNTELALLKSQINPHFFFNTLNNLYALTLDNSALASTVILKLSDLMRYTIYEGRAAQIELWQEIECLENYISLQHIRTQKAVNVQFKQSVDDDKIAIPPLLFLGFLENAFKHGVDGLRQDAFVSVDLLVEKGHLYFSILNNYDPEERPVGGGTGLDNVRRRLALLYPNQHELEIVDEHNVFRVDLSIAL
ncbi:MAG: histidine kinase [Bacteroidota bacterium]